MVPYVMLFYKPEDRINWTTSINFRWGKGYYDEIGKNLDQMNREFVQEFGALL